ncbi:hypothetical protein JW992_11065 [candidate division KSB1 bacterium]|nr:hypothetical protein [candidate division KSB1 bacterium]
MNRVELKWVVTHESQIKGYRIYRSLDTSTFTLLDFVPCRDAESGEKTYTFVDETVFKPNGNTYRYKLAVIDTGEDELFYDRIVTVNPQISSARHTWGSIKAMFR